MSSASSESPHWLQQVQSARDAEEQNLEAYVKDGQLFFRALRTIKQGSELLAWYKKDLSQLLSLISLESKGKNVFYAVDTEGPLLLYFV